MLLVINGAPGAGKSTLARLYADDHPLALIVDIDLLRTQLGSWATVDESKLVARDLAVAMAGAHLLTGKTVIVPQYLGRTEFLDRLRQIAGERDVPFVEVVLTADNDEMVRRFRARRAEHRDAGVEHPESDLDDNAIATEVAAANEKLLQQAAARGALIVRAEGSAWASYQSLTRVLVPLD